LNGLKSNEVQIGHPAFVGQVYLEDALTLLMSWLQTKQIEQLSNFLGIVSPQRQGNSLTAQKQHLHKHTTLVLRARVKTSRYHKQVAVPTTLILIRVNLSFVLITQYNFIGKPTHAL
jgi:hypothetical protein